MSTASYFNNSENVDLFKEIYEGPSMRQYNNATELLMMLPKMFNFVGNKLHRSLRLHAGASISAGDVPTINYDSQSDDQMDIQHKRVYSFVEIDGLAAAIGSNAEGFFGSDAMATIVERGVEGASRLQSIFLFGAGDGSVYTGNASNSNVSGTGNACDPYLALMDGDEGSIIWANLEVGDIFRVNSEASDLKVTAVTRSSGSQSVSLVGTSVRLAALSGAGPFTTTDKLYMQKSKDLAPEGLGILELTSGSTYGVSHENYRFQAKKIAAGGVAINEELLDELILGVQENCGETPDVITASFHGVRKIRAFLSDKVSIRVEARDKGDELHGPISFSTLAYQSDKGAIPIIADRYCPRSKVYALNTNKIEMLHAPGWGWFQQDGTLFMRRDTTDRYQARFGGYMQNAIQPHFHGVITGLATS